MPVAGIARAEGQGLAKEARTAITTTGRHDHAEGLRRVAARTVAIYHAEAMASTLGGVWEHLGGPTGASHLKAGLKDAAIDGFEVKGVDLALQPKTASPPVAPNVPKVSAKWPPRQPLPAAPKPWLALGEVYGSAWGAREGPVTLKLGQGMAILALCCPLGLVSSGSSEECCHPRLAS